MSPHTGASGPYAAEEDEVLLPVTTGRRLGSKGTKVVVWFGAALLVLIAGSAAWSLRLKISMGGVSGDDPGDYLPSTPTTTPTTTWDGRYYDLGNYLPSTKTTTTIRIKISTGGVSGLYEACSVDGDDCRATQCCQSPGSTCFRKNDHWATCNETCAHNAMFQNGKWVTKGSERMWECYSLSCAASGQNCLASRCCSNTASRCFKKNATWADCEETCASGDCEALLPTELECDFSECVHDNGCSGVACEYCREQKERECCLDEACKWARGEQVTLCREYHLEACSSLGLHERK